MLENTFRYNHLFMPALMISKKKKKKIKNFILGFLLPMHPYYFIPNKY